MLCIAIALLYAENPFPFIDSEAITLALGLSFFLLSRNLSTDDTIRKKDAYFTVTISWLVLGLMGSLPYIFAHSMPSLSDAIFESVSGFTTTGSSILTDIEALPKSVLFWRSLTHWIGGIGIIMLVIVILPSLKISGYHLFTSESSFQEKIKPKIQQVGFRLLAIYISMTLIETILLLLGKMNLFESICHAFGTIATGGFSPKNTSIADYSPYIQYVIMIFMLLSGTNFIIHYYAVKREMHKIKKNEELRFYLLITFLIGSILTGILFFRMQLPFEVAFRDAFFQIISIITSTGFASADYLLWPHVAWVIIFFSMFIGGSIGSTSGGIKIMRHLIIIKSIKRVFRQIIHPQAVIPVRLNGKNLSLENSNATLSFLITYLVIFLIGTLIMMFIGLDGGSASSSVATCMAGIGPGIGSVGPTSNFAHIPGLGKMVLAFLMIVGRLEIFTVFVLFTRNFWRS